MDETQLDTQITEICNVDFKMFDKLQYFSCIRKTNCDITIQSVLTRLDFLTNNTARLHSVLVDLNQVVGQVTQLWLHALLKPQKVEKNNNT